MAGGRSLVPRRGYLPTIERRAERRQRDERADYGTSYSGHEASRGGATPWLRRHGLPRRYAESLAQGHDRRVGRRPSCVREHTVARHDCESPAQRQRRGERRGSVPSQGLSVQGRRFHSSSPERPTTRRSRSTRSGGLASALSGKSSSSGFKTRSRLIRQPTMPASLKTMFATGGSATTSRFAAAGRPHQPASSLREAVVVTGRLR